MTDKALFDHVYRVRSWGPLHHRFWITQPTMKDGMIEETWHLGPFELVRHYVQNAPKYGSWAFEFTFALPRWRGPWFQISFGSGAQDWDKGDEFWKSDDA